MPDGFQNIREGVAQLCRQFPGPYWQRCDRLREYPAEFVGALMREGYLAAMIPEEYGGSGLGPGKVAVILEEIHRTGRQCRGLPCSDVHHGHGAASRECRSSKAALPAWIAEWLDFGCKRSASPSRRWLRHHRPADHGERIGDYYVVNGQKIWISRGGHSDLMLLLARTTPLSDQWRRRTDGLSVFLIDLGSDLQGHHIRPMRTMINHSTRQRPPLR